MRKLILFIPLLLSLSLKAQSFKLQSNKGLIDFNVCQENHNIILKKFSNRAENQAQRLLNGIRIEENNNVDSKKVNELKKLLTDIIIKKTIFDHLIQQFNKQNLSLFLSDKKNYSTPILSTENLRINILSTMFKTLDFFIAQGKITADEIYFKELKNDLARQILTYYLYKEGGGIASSIISGFVALQSGKVILKSFTISIGMGALSSAAKSLGLSLLTIPLMGHRQTPEELWTGLLKDHPALIIIPELMNKVGINDHAWATHCYAIQRRTKLMDQALKKAINSDESIFLNRIGSIYSSNPEPTEIESPLRQDDLNHYSLDAMQADNTNVVRTFKPDYVDLTPNWAFKDH